MDRHRVQRLFELAIELPFHEQEGFLREECGHNLELHNEVASLLSNHLKEDVSVMVKLNQVEPGRSEDGHQVNPFSSTSEAPYSLGRYRLKRKLGAGGMGVVYLADDPMLNRPVAIKVLHPGSHQTMGRERLLDEAMLLAQVAHPNVVDVYDVGLANGRPYIVMELLRGETLRQRLTCHGPLNTAAALNIVRQIAEALVHCHQHGIVHRDIKPENLFLVPDAELGERVKVLDFGIAKMWERGGGTIAGTPIYMSPEQQRGEPLDHRTDLYTLGIVLHELLTGHPPKTSQNAYAKIPQAVGLLLSQLLAPSPSCRLGSANHLLYVLEQLSPTSHDRQRAWDTAPAEAALSVEVGRVGDHAKGITVSILGRRLLMFKLFCVLMFAATVTCTLLFLAARKAHRLTKQNLAIETETHRATQQARAWYERELAKEAEAHHMVKEQLTTVKEQFTTVKEQLMQYEQAATNGKPSLQEYMQLQKQHAHLQLAHARLKRRMESLERALKRRKIDLNGMNSWGP